MTACHLVADGDLTLLSNVNVNYLVYAGSKLVGVGAVVFYYLTNNRIKDINFNLEDALSFDGNTGPYVQYTYARTSGILEKASAESITDKEELCITEDAESALIKTLSAFPEKVEQARRELEPSVISRYLLDVCADFNRFYHDCPVLRAQDQKVKNTRVSLVRATSIVLNNGLKLIGLKRPKNI